MVSVYLKNGHREDSHISLGWSPSSRRWKSKASGLEFPDDSNMKIQILATNITLKYHMVAPHPNNNQDFKKMPLFKGHVYIKHQHFIFILSGGKNIFCLAYQLRQPKRMQDAQKNCATTVFCYWDVHGMVLSKWIISPPI